MRGPYMNEDGDWWVAVEDVKGLKEARKSIVNCLSYEIPEEGTLRYIGKEKVFSLCDAPANEHAVPFDCDDACRRDVLAYHFEENRKW